MNCDHCDKSAVSTITGTDINLCAACTTCHVCGSPTADVMTHGPVCESYDCCHPGPEEMDPEYRTWLDRGSRQCDVPGAVEEGR